MARIRENIDFDWRFFLGEAAGAHGVDYDDAGWRKLDLPHDWSIEGNIDEAHPSGAFGGFFPGGVGWYRKEIAYRAAYAGKRVSVEFEGVYMNSEAWINGQRLGGRPYGYIGFCHDLTAHLDPKGKNVLAVRVDNSEQPNSRWHSGSGIYRHVWLTATEAIHVDHWGTFVATPEVSTRSATVAIRTTVANESDHDVDAALRSEIAEAFGEAVAAVESSRRIRAGGNAEFEQTVEVPNPQLWSPEHPRLYTLRSQVTAESQIADVHETRFGIRGIRFDADEGFLLNGERVKLRGVNEHHDGGCVGAAVPEAVLRRRLNILKAMGCNAVRTAHNPPSPALLDLCDEMGFCVMDEAFDEWNVGKVPFGYHRLFQEWAARDLADMIRRDRNHPCVVLWSVGNEIPERGKPEGVETVRRLVDICHAEDPTRPVTCGCNSIHRTNESGFAQQLDVVGYNGGGGSVFQYDEDHRTYPDRKMLATEVPHSLQTRGVYRTISWMRVRDSDKKPDPRDVGMPVPNLTADEVFPEFSSRYCSSYDNCSVRISARDAWRLTRDRDYFAGEFRWTGFDYLGEAHEWPNRCGNFGIIDLCGFPKDTYYFYQSQWTKQPMLHLLPHWTWPGKEGVTIPVWCYTNCDIVELSLNGRLLGIQLMGDRMNLSWDVVYQPGALKAVGKRAGQVVCVEEVHTAGAAAALALDVDRTSILADGRDAVHVGVRIVDAAGHFVPTTGDTVRFAVEGEGRLIGVDNGDPISHESCKSDRRSAFHGMCLAIVQSTRSAGTIRITASGEGLRSAGVVVRSESVR